MSPVSRTPRKLSDTHIHDPYPFVTKEELCDSGAAFVLLGGTSRVHDFNDGKGPQEQIDFDLEYLEDGQRSATGPVVERGKRATVSMGRTPIRAELLHELNAGPIGPVRIMLGEKPKGPKSAPWVFRDVELAWDGRLAGDAVTAVGGDDASDDTGFPGPPDRR